MVLWLFKKKMFVIKIVPLSFPLKPLFLNFFNLTFIYLPTYLMCLVVLPACLSFISVPDAYRGHKKC